MNYNYWKMRVELKIFKSPWTNPGTGLHLAMINCKALYTCRVLTSSNTHH